MDALFSTSSLSTLYHMKYDQNIHMGTERNHFNVGTLYIDHGFMIARGIFLIKIKVLIML